MKKIYLLAFLFFTLLLSHTQAQTVSVVANIWPPYVDTALEDDGLAMKIVKAAFKKSDYAIELTIEPLDKALDSLDIGAYDVVGAIWKTDERKNKLLFSTPYLTNNTVVITNANSQLEFTSLEDLQGLLVGVLKDYEYDDTFMQDSKILRFQANRLTQNLLAVQKGKLDVAVVDKRLALYELKKITGSNSNNFRFLPEPLSSRKLYLAAPIDNAQSQEIITQFNKGLNALRRDDSYQKILDEYTY